MDELFERLASQSVAVSVFAVQEGAYAAAGGRVPALDYPRSSR